MFSNLSQNSVLYIFDFNSTPKIVSGPIERISLPRPKYSSPTPTFETVVDIYATINGERREFKGIPNNAVADFGDETFILAESKEALNSYLSAMLQNSKSIINSVEKHNKLIAGYEEGLQELNPVLKAEAEKDKIVNELKGEVAELKQLILDMTKRETKQ